MVTESEWLLIARVAVTLALLVVAIVLLLVAPQDGDHPLAVLIVGTVLGYWLGHAELASTRSGSSGETPHG